MQQRAVAVVSSSRTQWGCGTGAADTFVISLGTHTFGHLTQPEAIVAKVGANQVHFVFPAGEGTVPPSTVTPPPATNTPAHTVTAPTTPPVQTRSAWHSLLPWLAALAAVALAGAAEVWWWRRRRQRRHPARPTLPTDHHHTRIRPGPALPGRALGTLAGR
jgi:hypothetical protein